MIPSGTKNAADVIRHPIARPIANPASVGRP